MVFFQHSPTKQNSKALNELRIKAKLILKSYRTGMSSLPVWVLVDALIEPDKDSDIKLKHVLNAVAKKAGFTDWQHAVFVLDGNWCPGDDAGTFWYSPKCRALLNIWCRNLTEAEEQLAELPETILLPYKKQFIVADEDFMSALGLDEHFHALKQDDLRNMAIMMDRLMWDAAALARIVDIFTR